MDTVHDLGGKQGFAPVDAGETEAPWHHDWEGRMWAISQSSRLPTITIDWWRHVVERLPPAAYMSIPYFEKWCLTEMACCIDEGLFSLDEAIAGHVNEPSAGRVPEILSTEQVIARNRASVKSFEEPTEAVAVFAPGDKVRTLAHSVPTHTRLASYARGRVGEVLAHRGAHPLPDKGAQGVDVPEHLYTVRFGAQELWGDEADPRDSVSLDLWESYLERV